MVLAYRRRYRSGRAAVAPQNPGLLYFYGFAGWFSFTNTILWPLTPAFPPTPGCRVLNSVAAGRRAALRATGYQMLAVVLVALIFLVSGWAASLAVLVGGAGVVSGSALAANIALGGGVVTARTALSKLVLGAGLKWVVVITIFAMASGVGRMAPLPLLAGLAVALIAQPLALNFCARVDRER